MDLRALLTALRRAWWLPVTGALVGACAGLALSLLQTPLYTSSTQLFVSTTGAASASDVLSGSEFSQQRVTSYAQLLTGDEVANRVVSRLGLHVSPRTIKEEISAEAVPQTVLINVDVTDPSPQQAQRVADAVGAEFTALASELEQNDESGGSPVKVTVTEPADRPTEPSAPKTVVNVGLGLVVGLLLGGGLAVGRSSFDRSVKDRDEVAALARAPMIGMVMKDEALERGHVISRLQDSRSAEDYRQLRTNLQFLNVDRPPKVIMVSSALPAEGKTTMAINLSLALADAGRRVVLIEADLRRPRVTKYMGMVGGVGLTNVLAGTANFDEVVQSYGSTSVSVLAAGPTPPNPGELLASSHMAELLDKLRASYDFLIVDAPPLLPVADASGLAGATDGVLLSVRYGTTRKEQLQQAAVTLERVRATTLGVVLNIVPPKADVAVAAGYGYGYGYGYSSSETAKHGK